MYATGCDQEILTLRKIELLTVFLWCLQIYCFASIRVDVVRTHCGISRAQKVTRDEFCSFTKLLIHASVRTRVVRNRETRWSDRDAKKRGESEISRPSSKGSIRRKGWNSVLITRDRWIESGKSRYRDENRVLFTRDRLYRAFYKLFPCSTH